MMGLLKEWLVIFLTLVVILVIALLPGTLLQMFFGDYAGMLGLLVCTSFIIALAQSLER